MRIKRYIFFIIDWLKVKNYMLVLAMYTIWDVWNFMVFQHTHTHKFTNRKNHEMIIYIYNLIYINEQISHMNMQKKK